MGPSLLARFLPFLIALFSLSCFCGCPGPEPKQEKEDRIRIQDFSDTLDEGVTPYKDFTPDGCFDADRLQGAGPGTVYSIGQSVVIDGVQSSVGLLSGSSFPGQVQVENSHHAGGTRLEFFISHATLRFIFSPPIRHLKFRYRDRGTMRHLSFNGVNLSAELNKPAGINGFGAPDFVVPFERDDYGFGTIYFLGVLNELQIGGDELSLDELCIAEEVCQLTESPLARMIPTMNPVFPPVDVRFQGTHGMALEVLGAKPRRIRSVKIDDLDFSSPIVLRPRSSSQRIS